MRAPSPTGAHRRGAGFRVSTEPIWGIPDQVIAASARAWDGYGVCPGGCPREALRPSSDGVTPVGFRPIASHRQPARQQRLAIVLAVRLVAVVQRCEVALDREPGLAAQ